MYDTSGFVDAGLNPANIESMGISTQRCSFLCWDVNNNAPLHNIITWKDCRSSKLVDQWNDSLYIQVIFSFSNLT